MCNDPLSLNPNDIVGMARLSGFPMCIYDCNCVVRRYCMDCYMEVLRARDAFCPECDMQITGFSCFSIAKTTATCMSIHELYYEVIQPNSNRPSVKRKYQPAIDLTEAKSPDSNNNSNSTTSTSNSNNTNNNSIAQTPPSISSNNNNTISFPCLYKDIGCTYSSEYSGNTKRHKKSCTYGEVLQIIADKVKTRENNSEDNNNSQS
jgi:hypothetical protein